MHRVERDGDVAGLEPRIPAQKALPQRREQHQHRHVEHGDDVDEGVAHLHVAQQVHRVVGAGDVGDHRPEERDAHRAQVELLAEGLDEQVDQVDLLRGLLVGLLLHAGEQEQVVHQQRVAEDADRRKAPRLKVRRLKVVQHIPAQEVKHRHHNAVGHRHQRKVVDADAVGDELDVPHRVARGDQRVHHV